MGRLARLVRGRSALCLAVIGCAAIVLGLAWALPRGHTARGPAGQKMARAATQPTLAPPLEFAPSSGPTVSIPIMLYHFIRVADPRDRTGVVLSVKPSDFAAQLDWLRSHGVRSLTPDEVFTAVQTGRQPVGRVVLLTFDDGFADFATTAAPLLASRGFTGIDYVVSGFIGTPGFMSALQLHAVERMGMHIGAHTVHHLPLADVSPATLVAEVTQSKSALEQLLGHPVIDFSYPYGSFNAAVEAQVRAAGFRTAVTTLPGLTQLVADPFGLHRNHVNGGETVPQFVATVAPAPPLPQPRGPVLPGPNLTAPSWQRR
jgi:peptidoglycan/xylan/chitin deacetylase (PgdA/CDA1 family)